MLLLKKMKSSQPRKFNNFRGLLHVQNTQNLSFLIAQYFIFKEFVYYHRSGLSPLYALVVVNLSFNNKLPCKDISDHKDGLGPYGLPMSPQTFV